MKKLLFTGASGFLGYNIRPILEKSYDVHTIGLTDDDDIKINDVALLTTDKAHVVPKTEAESKIFVSKFGDLNYLDYLCNKFVELP